MIRADVIYTGRYISDSYVYNNKKQRMRSLILWIAEVVFLAVLGVWALAYLGHSAISVYIKIALVFYAVSVFSNVKKIIKLLRQPKVMENTPPDEEKREFFFDDDVFTFVKRGTISEVKREFTYQNLYAATETNRYFFIHLYKHTVCIIGKNDFSEGTALQLRELLVQKMSDKFLIDTEGSI